MNIPAYLNRLNYTGPHTPDPETLRLLHRAHMFSVPFENLDIHLGRPIVMDEEAFFEKVVTRRRGGFCYELSGLFAALLRALGFDVTLLSAGVYSGDVPGPDFDHMTLLVNCDERWLADVGFGDFFIEPLRLDEPGEQIRQDTAYRVEQHEGHLRVLSREHDGTWKPGYRFTLTPRHLSDYSAMCRWQQTSPSSHFTQKRICSMATENGRVTLSEMKLIIARNGKREERMLESDEEYAQVLWQYFGMNDSSGWILPPRHQATK